jgi:hypothetical protein
MAVWAYECRPCAGSAIWLVSRERVDGMPADVRILRMKTGSGWACAIVDRSRPVEVEAMLLRDAVASDERDCPECAAHKAGAAAPAAVGPAPTGSGSAAAALQAAAISVQGRRMLVVLVRLDVVQNAGEADMLIADLRARFGGIDVVLMGQNDDGTPRYHSGDAELVKLLANVPIDRMPWQGFPSC